MSTRRSGSPRARRWLLVGLGVVTSVAAGYGMGQLLAARTLVLVLAAVALLGLAGGLIALLPALGRRNEPHRRAAPRARLPQQRQPTRR